MNNENNTIYDFELNLICDFFSNMERQGSGSPEATLKALGFIDNLTEKSLIADIGCGTGGQTRVLAQHTPGQIIGLDLLSPFIHIFNHNARLLGLQTRVKGIVGSMDNLPFEQESLDLIWSEGAIYNIGFERGLHEWRKYLKNGRIYRRFGKLVVYRRASCGDQRFLDKCVSRNRYHSESGSQNTQSRLPSRRYIYSAYHLLD